MTSFSWLIGKKCIINELFSTLNSFWMACPFELVNPSLKSYDCIHFQNQKIFSLFSLNFADVSIYYRHFSCHFRWRQVSWRDVIMADFHKIIRICLPYYILDPVQILSQSDHFSGKYSHQRAKISWNMRKMRKSTWNHNFVKNDRIHLKIGHNWDIIDVHWFWDSYENPSHWRHITSHDVFFTKIWKIRWL